jgi:hypothetical protein
MNKSIRFIDNFYYYDDGGWGQRIYSLEQAYYIGYKMNFEYNILVQTPHWPELHFLDIPKVTGIECDDIQEFIKTSNGEKASYLNSELMNDVLMNGKHNILRQSNHWYFDEWIEETKDLVKETFFIKKVKFKDPKIEEYLKNNFKDVVGFHLRRKYWVKVEEKDLETLPEHLREKYWKETEKYRDTPVDQYLFIPDHQYFKVLDKIVERNKKQKIFISSDISPEFYAHYYEKYDIITYENFKKEFKELLSETVDKEVVNRYPDTINALFDAFALSYCKLIVNSPSCFSMFSSDRNEVPTITIKRTNKKFIVFNYPHHKGFLHNN